MPLTQEGTRKTVRAGDNIINYHEAGEGEPLILIHGSGPGAAGWSNYSRNFDHLAAHFRVIALDLPGFGASSKPDVPYERVYSYYAGVITDFLDAIGVERASFVGNSMGGGATIKFALDNTDRAIRLVLMGAGGGFPIFSPQPAEGVGHLLDYYEAPGPTREKLRKFLEVMVFDSNQLTDALIEERFQMSTQADIIANPLFNRTRRPGGEPLFPQLPKLTTPTLLIWGRDDRTVPFDNAFIMLKLIPDVRLHVFGKCGHWTQWERADEFNALVTGFLLERR
jgi:4,5:9,10-diseco-3-hydroxy-5,9,17-trioxoandrosta-1(10),2-diene-4-oate hydrolase